jgi:hypothetical protein
MSSHQFGSLGPNLFVAEDPIVMVTCYRNEAHNACLAVASPRSIDFEPVKEHRRTIESLVSVNLVEPLHSRRTFDQKTVNVVAPFLSNILEGTCYVEKTVGVGPGQGRPFLWVVGVIRTGCDPVGPLRTNNQTGKRAENVH